MQATWRSGRVWAAVVVVLTAADPARAFYWHDWPGSRLRVEPTLIGPPSAPVVPTNPPPAPRVDPPPFFPPPPPPIREPNPPIGPPVPVDRPPVGPPTPTPEPATALLGLLGLGALAARRWRAKQNAD